MVRKRQHPAPRLDDIDPDFNIQYNEALHGDAIKKDLNIDYLPSDQQEQLSSLIKEFWCVFDPKGLNIPVKDYECCIDTGSNAPVSCRNVTYGPLETPKIANSIAQLLALGLIYQVFDGAWCSKGLLAPKPHQEHITDIDNFIWRFCISYVALNSVTKVVAYPIPRCDEAVGIDFGGVFRWIMDAPSGYHQIRVALEDQCKLAFAGPGSTKYTWKVMPFGPVNGPVTFIIFIHDMDGTWKEIARTRGIDLDSGSTGTRIIVDDIFSWAPTFAVSLLYLRCQLEVCRCQNLSLSLKKCLFFPPRIEFVGHDVCADGNRPAQTKRSLLNAWPIFKTVRDLHSFVGFLNFYGPYIPNMEMRISNLRELMKEELDTPLGTAYTSIHDAERADMLQALLADPCLMRYNPEKRCYLRTDFSSLGFGTVLLQPDDDEASLAAMKREMEGGPCEFMQKGSTLRLRPISFAARRCRGREAKLHSHLGEGMALDWALNKFRARLWGRRFTAITDCYGLRFIMSYDGDNPVILRLQMRFMLWAMDLHHRTNEWLVDADYFSRCGADLSFDPLVTEYLNYTTNLRKLYPPISGTMQPENMPGFRGPRFQATFPSDSDTTASAAFLTPATSSIDPALTVALSGVFLDGANGMSNNLHNVPICFGTLDSVSTRTVPLYNGDIASMACSVSSFAWGVYGFNNGHFFSTMSIRNLPFRIVLAADTRPSGRALFKEHTNCPHIADSSAGLLQHIVSSKVTSPIHGYFIHSHRFLLAQTQVDFWRIQSAIVRALQTQRRLQIFVAHVHPDCDHAPITSFRRSLTRTGWILSSTDVYFPQFGDSIADGAQFIIGLHRTASSNHDRILLPTPPPSKPSPLAQFVYAPFNRRDYALSPARLNPAFKDSGLTASAPTPSTSTRTSLRQERAYNIHRPSDDPGITAGTGVYFDTGLCPPFCGPNTNLFGCSFGIEFSIPDDSHQFVRSISPYEFVSCYGLDRNMTYAISQPTQFPHADCGIPALTSFWLLHAISERLLTIQLENFEVFDSSNHSAPAAFASVPSFLNGAIGVTLPSPSRWIEATSEDPETSLIIKMLTNPGKFMNKDNISSLHHIYRHPIREGHLLMEKGLIYLRETFQDSDKFVKLLVVPEAMQNIVFVAFHSNPIGAHLSAFRTYARMRLRYFWPHMYKYCFKLIKQCPGCALGNITRHTSSDLVYGFPVCAPMKVMMVDIYSVGTEVNFEGNIYHLIACDAMTAFAVSEPVPEQNARSFAGAIMKIWLRFGFSHTLVVDKDSKFRGVFAETAKLLNINLHVLSGGNHDAMMVERVNRFLNASLVIFCNERGTIKVSESGILLALYAWNSAPVVGTDISRSLVVVGREFHFPIDFSAEQHHMLTSTPAKLKSFAGEQAQNLKACRLICETLIKHHRNYHREHANLSRDLPKKYSLGDFAFSRRSVKSDKSKGVVAKVKSPYTGPWEITKVLPGSSYEIRHKFSGELGKRHAAHLSPFPLQLVPFEPVDGADNRYSQMYQPIKKDPYEEAGIKGFKPYQPFREQLPAIGLSAAASASLHFPSLAELNADICNWSEGEMDLVFNDDTLTQDVEIFTSNPSVIPSEPVCAAPPVTKPTLPLITDLTSNLITSRDRLFFIAHRVPGTNVSEWSLVRVALEDSLALNPQAFHDGRFLVDFYICHPQDKFFNAVNQRYWLEYHPQSSVESSPRELAHLIRPSSSSSQYARAEGLRPFRQWVRLIHADTYITGPFNFASIGGRQSPDRVPLDEWKALHEHSSLFSNATPSLELPDYSVHLSSFHETLDNSDVAARFTTCAANPHLLALFQDCHA